MYEDIVTSNQYNYDFIHQAMSTFEKIYVSACCIIESNRSNN
jgi:hypothetical protein